METHRTAYYEQPALWDRELASTKHGKRIDETIAAIPPEARSILDVGCGNGLLVNNLAKTFPGRFDRLVGIDSSVEALKHVQVESSLADIVALPFDDCAFDLVTCLEVLEHIPAPAFQPALHELQRVSRGYLLVTVPNAQDLLAELVICPKCCCCFNRDLHVRSFDEKDLAGLFPRFELIDCRGIGPLKRQRRYGRLSARARLVCERRIAPHKSVCPQCGFQTLENSSEDVALNNSIRRLGYSPPLWSLVKRLIPKQRKSTWLLGLYKRLP